MNLVTEAKERSHAQILGADAAFLRRDDLARSVPQNLARPDKDRQSPPALGRDIAAGACDLERRICETDPDLRSIRIEFVLDEFAQDVGRSVRQHKLIDLA
ncbi:MAG: hypothetical protein ABI240_05340 [Sphingomonas sp.]